MYGALLRQVLGDGPPLAPTAEDVHHTVDHLADIDLARAPAAFSGRARRLQPGPLVAGKIAGIAPTAPPVELAALLRPDMAPREPTPPGELQVNRELQAPSANRLKGPGNSSDGHCLEKAGFVALTRAITARVQLVADSYLICDADHPVVKT